MTAISTLGQSLAQVDRLKELQLQFDNLNSQLATGKKTQKFSGLGENVLTSKRTRADFKSLDTYIGNAKKADTRINLTLNAIEEFQAQVKELSNLLVGFSQQGAHQQGDIVYYDNPSTEANDNIAKGYTSGDPDLDLKTLQDLAEGIFDFVGELLNSKEGNRYLLGGAETNTKPFDNNGILDTAMSTLFSNWKDEGSANNITTASFINALKGRDASVDPDAMTDSIVGFNAALSSGTAGSVFSRVDENADIDYTALANDKGFRDVLVAVSFFKNPALGPIADVYTPPNAPPNAPDIKGAPGDTLQEQKENFYAVFNQMTSMVNNALDEIDGVRFKLENARARIDEVSKKHQDTQNLLLNVISDTEDADINEVALKINILQIQMEASYSVTASISKLSLVNYI